MGIKPGSLVFLAAVSGTSAQWVPKADSITSGVYALYPKGGALFAGTDQQGSFRSDDLGEHWQSLASGWPERSGTYTFLEFGGKLFAGTYDGVFYSDDGAHWTVSDHRNWQALHAVGLAGNGKYLFASSSLDYSLPFNRGLFRSADTGKTWTPVKNGFTATIWINAMAQHKGVVYVGTSGEGAFRSSDNGDTWIPFNKGFPEGSSANARSFYADVEKLYAGTHSGVYVLAANGNSWTRISNGLPNELLVTSIVGYGGHLFAGASMLSAGGVFHSSDGGASWRRVSNAKDSEPLEVASLAVLGDRLFASTGRNVCGELGCGGSAGSVWRVSIPGLLGITAVPGRSPGDGKSGWERTSLPGAAGSRAAMPVFMGAYDAAGRRVP